MKFHNEIHQMALDSFAQWIKTYKGTSGKLILWTETIVDTEYF